MKISIDINTSSKKWKLQEINYKTLFQDLATFTLTKYLPTKINKITLNEISISVLLTGNRTIKKLNKEYRDKDKPTNVLSFPMLEVFDKTLYLGDIAIAYETLAIEAIEQTKSFHDHLTHLFTHSLLHLIGFDHETSDKDAKEMEQIERKILEHFNISDPY